eukprot:GCRY01004740.1.p1 GENE.GCRY01004740.1~~GCRY01004740.1.p1  ORF type:complete len:378 (+),score=86.42 GCRY01004740.1:139-1272(+)
MSLAVRIAYHSGGRAHKTVKVGATTTAKECRHMIGEKLELQEDSLPLFQIWAIGPKLSLPLAPNDRIVNVLRCWDKICEKFKLKKHGQKNTVPCMLIFQLASVFSKKAERNCKDEVALELIYYQVSRNFILGWYPVDDCAAVDLAALKIQVFLGDYNAETHKSGFLQPVLKDFLPRCYVESKSASSWENILLEKFKEISGKKKSISMLLFLSNLRRLPYYGCNFFSAVVEHEVKKVFGKKTVQEKKQVGFNTEGIFIFKHADKYKLTLEYHFPYETMTTWDVAGHECVLSATDPAGIHSTVKIFSAQALLMDNMVQDVMDLAEQEQNGIQQSIDKERNAIDDLNGGDEADVSQLTEMVQQMNAVDEATCLTAVENDH